MRKSQSLFPFNSAFRRVERPHGSTEVKASTIPARPRKFPLLNESNGKMFWEEFRDSQVKVKKTADKSKKFGSADNRNIIPLIDHPQSNDSISTHSSTSPPPQVIRTAEEASAVLSSPIGHYLDPQVSPLSLPPKVLGIAESLVTARHADQILNRVQIDKRQIENDSLLSSIAIHRLGKLVGGKKTPLALIRSTDTFRDLLEIIESQINVSTPLVPVRNLCNILWAINRLELFTEIEWTNKLVDQMSLMVNEIPLDQISSVLYTLVYLEKNGNTKNLREAVVDIAVSRREELGNSDMISIATSLARLGRFENKFMLDLSDRIIRDINTISINDLVSVLWSITTLKVTDTQLMSRLIHMIGGRVSECSLRNLVDIVWSISKSIGSIRRMDENLELNELFRFTIAPAIRSKLIDCSVRELATILWSFSTAEVFDPDFFHDVSLALVPRVSEMNAHDISSVLWALGSINYSHSDLMSAIKHAAIVQKNFFTPLQLSRVIYGLGAGGVTDKKVFEQLVKSALERSHLLYTQNLVEILIGLNYAKLIGLFGSEFLHLLANQTDKISGRDGVQLLSILGENKGKISLIDNDELIKYLIDMIKERFNLSGRWIPSGYDVVELVHAIHSLRIEDPELLEKVLIHLSSVYKSPSFSNELFLRLLEGMANLCSEASPRTSNTISKLSLLRTKGIAAAMESLTEKFSEKTHLMSLGGKIQVIDWFAKIRYCDDNVEKMISSLRDRDIRILIPSVGIDSILNLTVACAELGVEPDWTMAILDSITPDHIESSDQAVKYMWSKLAMGEGIEHIADDCLEKLTTANEQEEEVEEKEEEESLSNLTRSHQVALSLQKRLPECSTNVRQWCETTLAKKPWYLQSAPSKQTCRKSKKIGSKSLSKLIDKYSSLVSLALNDLGIVHSVNPIIVPNVYTCSIAIPNSSRNPSLLVDILGPSDVVSPGGSKWTGRRILKGIHIANFSIVNLAMVDIQKAVEANSLNPFIADRIAPFVTKAKERVQFIPQPPSEAVDDLLLGR